MTYSRAFVLSVLMSLGFALYEITTYFLFPHWWTPTTTHLAAWFERTYYFTFGTIAVVWSARYDTR